MNPHKDWPHAPVHRFDSQGIYMVTGATMYKEHFFGAPKQLDSLENSLLTLAKRYQWQLEAWAVFSNHYHFIGRRSPVSDSLKKFLQHLHSETAREINKFDDISGRQVWFNFWETKLTYERSYLARLAYVHRNPVKHGLVVVANQYLWSSARWFERVSSPAAVKTIYSFKTDKLRIDDDY